MGIAFDNNTQGGKAPEVEPQAQTQTAQQQEEFSKTPGSIGEEQKSFSGAPSVGSDLFSRFSAIRNTLTGGALDFLNEVQNTLNNSRLAQTGKIEVVRLVKPQEAHVFIYKNYAVPFVFEEYVRECGSCVFMAATIKTTPAELSEDVFTQLHRVRPDVEPVSLPVVIAREDYSRGVNFGQWLEAMFTFRAMPEQFTCEKLFRGKRLEIHDNEAEYDAVYDMLCPHKTQLRADVKLTFWLTDANRPRNNQDTSERRLYQVQSQDQCVGCMGLVTDFIDQRKLPRRDPMTGDPIMPFKAVTYVSDINLAIPSATLGYLLIARAKPLILQNRIWLNPYLTGMDIDAHDKHRAITALMTDAEGKILVNPSADQCREFIDKFVDTRTQILVELNEGRALAYRADRSDSDNRATMDSIIKDVEEFLGTQANFQPSIGMRKVIDDAEVKYRGFYYFGNKVLDTDNIDALTEICKSGIDGEEIIALRNAKTSDPERLMEAQRRIESSANIRYLYRTAVQEIDPNLLTFIDNVASAYLGPSYFNQMRPEVDIASYQARAQRWSQYGESRFAPGASFFAYDGYHGRW